MIDHAEKFVVTFPEDKRGRAVGLWAGVAGSGAMLGILLSGVLLTTWSWKSTFIVSAAAGLMLCVVSPAIPESRSTARERFDVLGAALSALAVGTLVAALIEGPTLGWSDPLIVTGFVVAALATAGFVVA
ncbi:MFS transporter, partial [Dietzia sp. SLG310A2-38A2]|uniref:MFS transporter n=1 Tax=Dietzia sp. SLG310A2-38A2 TaxID=1630643 RepID=UPI0015F8B0FD|nr:MFS transporter [Dietzia sp. SLG310A2-38A2]